ncbi:hypothetical protein AVEN_66426-1 [Araneus ventricosus]|uniref:Uncharacterized protein n=1 Tax=Araneus ventricosus TaxID=182803 RepID=A0A4Y2EIN1_ARAVE|nr:hypothetical protein AVEN_66426-1 [Araneus ventricosus]
MRGLFQDSTLNGSQMERTAPVVVSLSSPNFRTTPLGGRLSDDIGFLCLPGSHTSSPAEDPELHMRSREIVFNH